MITPSLKLRTCLLIFKVPVPHLETLNSLSYVRSNSVTFSDLQFLRKERCPGSGSPGGSVRSRWFNVGGPLFYRSPLTARGVSAGSGRVGPLAVEVSLSSPSLLQQKPSFNWHAAQASFCVRRKDSRLTIGIGRTEVVFGPLPS